MSAAKAAGESSKPFIWKAHDDRRHLVDFFEPGLAVVCAAGQDRCRLSPEQITGGIDAIEIFVPFPRFVFPALCPLF